MSLRAAFKLAMVVPGPGPPSRPTDSSRIVYVVLLIAYASSIWYGIAHGSPMEPWFRRQRLHASARICTCPFVGALSESLVSWHRSSSFGRLSCVTSIYSRVAKFRPIDTSQVAQPSCLVTLMVPDTGRGILVYLACVTPDLTIRQLENT
jgi:hypothetical protein